MSIALPPNTLVANYRIEKLLGEGGFGLTYLAFDENLHIHCAIKEYLPADFSMRGDDFQVQARTSAAQEDFDWGLEAFIHEARTLVRFSNRYIVSVRHFFCANGTAYIVMEYVQGRTLSDLVKDVGRLSEAEVRAILLPVMDALQDVHDACILHRDIKPDNILIRDNGIPVLIDFGAARQAMANKSRSMTTILTPGYAPIEQYASRGNVGPWSDIYALAAVAYYCLTQQIPVESSQRVLQDELPSLASIQDLSASRDFLHALDQALAIRPEQRPANLADFVESMNQNAKVVPKPDLGDGSILPRSPETILHIPDPTQETTASKQLEFEQLSNAEIGNESDDVQSIKNSLKQPSEIPQSEELQKDNEFIVRLDGLRFLSFLVVVASITIGILVYLAQKNREYLLTFQQELDPQAKFEILLSGNKMIRIEPGSFLMGNDGSLSNEKPVRRVTIGKAFLLSQYEVTFAQYDQFVAATGRSKTDDKGWGRGQRPVINVTWLDARDYANWLSEQTGLSFRLPSEAEWEYAARAGSMAQYAWGDVIDCGQARYGYTDCDSKWPLTVGRFQPNAWALYDMHGNVAEWVEDCWHDNYDAAPQTEDVWLSGDCEHRIQRGGSWLSSPSNLRSASRYRYGPLFSSSSVGFRLAQDVTLK